MAQTKTVTHSKATHFSGVMANVQELTVSGIVKPGINFLELNHATVVIAATIADAKNHQFLMVKDTSATGTAAHTVTLASGTWNGSHTIMTMNALNEAVLVVFDSAGNGTIIVNVDTVTFS